MAIAKTRAAKPVGGKRPFPWITTLSVLVVLGVFVWWFYGEALRGYALAGTGYGAKGACSCRHIAGRSLNSCEADFVPGMEIIFLSENEGAKSVTAYVPLIASQTARYRDGYGCVLDSPTG